MGLKRLEFQTNTVAYQKHKFVKLPPRFMAELEDEDMQSDGTFKIPEDSRLPKSLHNVIIHHRQFCFDANKYEVLD